MGCVSSSPTKSAKLSSSDRFQSKIRKSSPSMPTMYRIKSKTVGKALTPSSSDSFSPNRRCKRFSNDRSANIIMLQVAHAMPSIFPLNVSLILTREVSCNRVAAVRSCWDEIVRVTNVHGDGDSVKTMLVLFIDMFYSNLFATCPELRLTCISTKQQSHILCRVIKMLFKCVDVSHSSECLEDMTELLSTYSSICSVSVCVAFATSLMTTIRNTPVEETPFITETWCYMIAFALQRALTIIISRDH